MYERVGEIPPLAYVLSQFNPATQEVHECEAIACFSVMSDGSVLTTEQFAYALHGFADVTHAVGVVFASECWVAFGKKGEDLEKVDIEHHPERKEGIFLALEHRKLRGVYGYFAEISRPNSEDGAGTLGPFENVYLHKLLEAPDVTSQATAR
jgi:hypothetical protein